MPLNILKILIFILLARRIRPYCALHTVYPGNLNKFHRVNYYNNWQKKFFPKNTNCPNCNSYIYVWARLPFCESLSVNEPFYEAFRGNFFLSFQSLPGTADRGSFICFLAEILCLLDSLFCHKKQTNLPLLNKNMLLQEIVAMPFYWIVEVS